MGISDTYNQLITQIITSLKTNTLTSGYLQDAVSGQAPGPRVVDSNSNVGPRMVDNDYFAYVSRGQMIPKSGYTTHSTYNEFTLGVTLMYFATDYTTGFNSAMVVAEKIYDLFHLTNINNLCRIAYVSIHPDPVAESTGELYTIVIHVVIKCETYITQP